MHLKVHPSIKSPVAAVAAVVDRLGATGPSLARPRRREPVVGSWTCRGVSDFQPEPDGQLWQRAQTGDEAAFEAVFDRHSTRIYNFCYRTTGSWSQAEDLLAIVFLQAWRQRDKVQAERDTVPPWLLSIANNTCRNEHRSLRRHSRLIIRLQDARPAVEPDFSDSADQELDARAGNSTLRSCMTQWRGSAGPRATC